MAKQTIELTNAQISGTFSGTVTYDDGVETPPPGGGEQPDNSQFGRIEPFATSTYARIGRTTAGTQILYGVHSNGQARCIQRADDYTLRYEVRPGDCAPYDSPSSVQRSEVESDLKVEPGQVHEVDFEFMLEAGDAVTASWFVFAEMHNDDEQAGNPTSPPYAIEIGPGDIFKVIARWCATNQNPSNAAGNLTLMELWTDSEKFRRGQYYRFRMQARAVNDDSGFLRVWKDGVQVVDYSGPLGYGPYRTYWLDGLYLESGNTTQRGNVRHFYEKAT